MKTKNIPKGAKIWNNYNVPSIQDVVTLENQSSFNFLMKHFKMIDI